MKRIAANIAALTFIISTGCQNPGVVQLSGDTYMVSRMSAAGAFANASMLKADVIKEANAFAESKGKVAVHVASKEMPAIPGRMPSFEYQFKLVDKSSPEARGGAMIRRADLVIEKKETIAADIKTRQSNDGGDLYTELMKLDDLRKKGILSEPEFEAQKKRLLSKTP